MVIVKLTTLIFGLSASNAIMYYLYASLDKTKQREIVIPAVESYSSTDHEQCVVYCHL